VAGALPASAFIASADGVARASVRAPNVSWHSPSARRSFSTKGYDRGSAVRSVAFGARSGIDLPTKTPAPTAGTNKTAAATSGILERARLAPSICDFIGPCWNSCNRLPIRARYLGKAPDKPEAQSRTLALHANLHFPYPIRPNTSGAFALNASAIRNAFCTLCTIASPAACVRT
jgi:hypothetical protein